MNKIPFVHTLSGRLLLYGAVPTLLAIGAIIATSAIDGYREMRRTAKRLLDLSADGAAAELSVHNARWNDVAASMAFAQADGMFGQRKASCDFARSVAASFPLTIGAYFAYEPDADGQDAAALVGGEVPREAMDGSGRFLPYWYVDSASGGGGRTLKLKPNADMETLEYYLAPKGGFERTGKTAPTLTEPYLYEGVTMVSHTYPIVRNGKFLGICGVDRGLDPLAGAARDIKARLGADVFILSAGGRFIATTTGAEGGDGGSAPLQMREVAGTAYAPLAARWRSASAGGDVFEADDPVLGESCIYATCPVEVGGWNVVVRRTEADALQAARTAVKRSLLVGSLGLAVIGVLLAGIARAVGRRVRGAAEMADRIARGDLTQEVGTSTIRDETGQLIRSMSAMDGNLNALVGSVHEAGVRLSSTATEITATSRQQEVSASTFGAASSQIAAAIKEISATGKDLVRSMASVSEHAVETAALAGAGRAGLKGMEAVMRELDRATASVAEKLGVIDDRSKGIASAITTMTRVADQTNLLSINAEIEAEKAGGAGAGFHVIASEIRRLADESAEATLDIEKIVEQMQGAVASGVQEMGRFTDQVRRGVRDVATTGSQLAGIIDRVNRSTESVAQVDESMRAQAEGAEQISGAMSALSGNAQQTMESVHSFGRASDDLQTAIDVLRAAVARFTLKPVAGEGRRRERS